MPIACHYTSSELCRFWVLQVETCLLAKTLQCITERSGNDYTHTHTLHTSITHCTDIMRNTHRVSCVHLTLTEIPVLLDVGQSDVWCLHQPVSVCCSVSLYDYDWRACGDLVTYGGHSHLQSRLIKPARWIRLHHSACPVCWQLRRGRQAVLMLINEPVSQVAEKTLLLYCWVKRPGSICQRCRLVTAFCIRQRPTSCLRSSSPEVNK